MDNATDCLWPRPQPCVSSAPVFMEIPLTKTLCNGTFKKQALNCKRTSIKLQYQDFHPFLQISRHKRHWYWRGDTGKNWCFGDLGYTEHTREILILWTKCVRSLCMQAEESSNDLLPPFLSPIPIPVSLSLCLSVSILLCTNAYSHRETVGLCPLVRLGGRGCNEVGLKKGGYTGIIRGR